MDYYAGFCFRLDYYNKIWMNYYETLSTKTVSTSQIARYFFKGCASDLNKIYKDFMTVESISNESQDLSRRVIQDWDKKYENGLYRINSVCCVAIPGYVYKTAPIDCHTLYDSINDKIESFGSITDDEYVDLIERFFLLKFGIKPEDSKAKQVEFFIPAMIPVFSFCLNQNDFNILTCYKFPIEEEVYIDGYFYIKDTGEYVGHSGTSEDCYAVTEKKLRYCSDSQIVPSYSIHDVKDLHITHENFRKQAATIYGESTAYNFGKSDKAANGEIFAIAEVFKVNKKAYGASSVQAKEFLRETDKGNNSWESRKASYAAIIYTIFTINPNQYSNGATHWDGCEQAIYTTDKKSVTVKSKFTDGKTEFELHMNTWGWYITDEHYKEWKKNIGSNFKAPQKKKATYGINKGKICALSTAVYNQTIFWKVKNGGYKDDELK